ncbi:hypothetical protein COEREDRAFT_25277, partial [Coemansia reversa NRRL 1564]
VDMFCTGCAEKIKYPFSQCLACQTAIELPSGMTTVSLNLSEKRKSLILAGLDPSTVMDICSRALSFWSYQMALEFAYQ